MISLLTGTVYAALPTGVVLAVGGVGFRVSLTRTEAASSIVGSSLTVHTHLHVTDSSFDLYGFGEEGTLSLFQRLIALSGVGPKLALTVLDVMTVRDFVAAVDQNRPDLIAQTPGIGKKTAERIVIELRGKLDGINTGEAVARMDRDTDVIEALAALGYQRAAVRAVLEELEPTHGSAPIEDRLKAALSLLGKR